MHAITEQRPDDAVPVIPLTADELGGWLEASEATTRRWVKQMGFEAKGGTHCLVPGPDGALEAVLTSAGCAEDPFALAHLPGALPKGVYFVDASWEAERLERTAVGWGLGAYRFDRYKSMEPTEAVLALDPAADKSRVQNQIVACCLVRNLINTPAEDMTPAHLADEIESLGRAHGCEVTAIVGDDLLRQNYPAIHTVGRAGHTSPRLVDLRWGAQDHPRVTLVGKGVCFDSGGLDLKTADGMRLMKKDMGGAAHAVGLASLVMASELPVRLRLLVAAVENAVAGNAYRPGDIIRARNGRTIEIDNTDAEGRVVLSDALVEAAAEQPELIVDFATLTGAARVALGPDLPAMFCNRDPVAAGLLAAASRVGDPIWRMPLHAPYRELIDSPFADIVNAAQTRYAGAITAALFLQDFVGEDTPWVHFDLMAWNTRSRPGRPEGGEAMGLRGVFEYLRERYPSGD